MLRILYDDFDQKVKNIHDEMDLHHSYKKKRVCGLKFRLLKNKLKYERSDPYSAFRTASF